MANSILTPSVIAKEALMAFKNKLGFTANVDKQYSEEFAVKGAKVGSSITIRKPPRFTVASGATLSNQDVTEESASLTLDSQKHVAFNFTSQELTLSIDAFKERYLDNAVLALANKVDMDGLQMAAQNVANSVGSPGTTPSAALTYLQAQQKLNEFACPQDLSKRSFHVNPAAQTSIVDALKGLFQSSEKIAEQYESGVMGMGLGGKWYLGQNIYSHTSGQRGGTPLMNGATSSGASSIVTDGWTASAANRVKKGDVFTIAGVYAVNPITKQSTGSLQQFVATADAASDGSGNATIAIYPSIVTSGSTQTVDAVPADNAALTFISAASTVNVNNILMHKNAFTLGCADLELPQGVHFAAVASDKETGLSIRIVRAYDISNDAFPCRLDVLYGWKAVRPEWACRIIG
jgi:hypothetical protein